MRIYLIYKDGRFVSTIRAYTKTTAVDNYCRIKKVQNTSIYSARLFSEVLVLW